MSAILGWTKRLLPRRPLTVTWTRLSKSIRLGESQSVVARAAELTWIELPTVILAVSFRGRFRRPRVSLSGRAFIWTQWNR